MKKLLLNKLAIVALMVVSGHSFALPLSRSDITIYDGDSKYNTGWYGKSEDQEVEPGMVRNQSWDMEGFFLKSGSSSLGMISGFNFKTGNSGFTAGDIFIDVNGDHIAGSATRGGYNGNYLQSAAGFGYDFVLDVDWTSIDRNGTGTYRVIKLDPNSTVTTPYYPQNYGSGPFEYVSGGTVIGSSTFNFEQGLTDADTGYLGGNHYAAFGFDLGFLGGFGVNEYWVSNTMGCGNDHLLGHGTVASVPEPSALALLAIGFIGLALARRKS